MSLHLTLSRVTNEGDRMRSKFRVGALLALALVVVAMTATQTAQANTASTSETENTALQLAGVPCQVDMQTAKSTTVATNEPAEEMLRIDGAAKDAIESNNCGTTIAGSQDQGVNEGKLISMTVNTMVQQRLAADNLAEDCGITTMTEPAQIQYAICDITRSSPTAIYQAELSIFYNQAIRGAPTDESATTNLALTAILPNLNSTQVPEVALTHRDNDASPTTSLQFADASVSIARNLVLRL